MKETILIIHNIRSTYNVGSLLRTAECLGIKKVYITGYSPYPKLSDDSRIPYIAERADKKITKTALGAEKNLDIIVTSLVKATQDLKTAGFMIVGLEQTTTSKQLNTYKPPSKTALLIGSERDGMDESTLELCDEFVEIEMRGTKESLNVAQATAIALYVFCYL